MMEENKTWIKRWSGFNNKKVITGSATYPLGIISKIGYDFARKVIQKNISTLNLNKNAKILDVGCGEGRTLEYFRDMNFMDIYGVDVSPDAINAAVAKGFKKNKQVFVMDGQKLKFKNKYFDVVFSEGLLEHFTDFSKFVNEMVRVSKKYVVLIQPNHFSLCGRIINFIVPLIQKDHVKEYDYKIEDFVDAFGQRGMTLIRLRGNHLDNFGKRLIDTGNIFIFKKE